MDGAAGADRNESFRRSVALADLHVVAVALAVVALLVVAFVGWLVGVGGGGRGGDGADGKADAEGGCVAVVVMIAPGERGGDAKYIARLVSAADISGLALDGAETHRVN